MGCPQLSFLVPIYNGAALLPRCLDSILAQSVQDWECLLVDDGSTDGSGPLCDRYAAEDARFRVIHQSNAGVSTARNAGMAQARGDWLQCVDADDALAPDYCAALLAAAPGVDLVIAGYTIVQGGRRTPFSPERETLLVGPDALCEQFDPLYFSMLLNSPCNKLYRRALLNTPFPPGLTMGEDFIFNMAILAQAERVALLPHTGYLYYKDNEHSAVSSFSRNTPERMMEYCRATLPVLERGDAPDLTARTYHRIVFHSLCNNLNIAARGRSPLLPLMDRYLAVSDIRQAVQVADTGDFPRSKRLVQALLRRNHRRAVALGLRLRRG